jgi:hypothetical protein
MSEHTRRRFLASLAAATVAGVGGAHSTMARRRRQSWVPTIPVTATEVNVKDFGAAGNGDDDTTAIHAARDAAGIGGTVVVPAGTYFTTGLLLNKASQVWQIMPDATIKSMGSGATAGPITVDAENVTINGGGVVDGNRTVIGDNAHVWCCITGTTNSNDLTIEGITVQNSIFYGVWGQASRTRVLRCTFLGNYTVPIMLSSYHLSVVLGGTMQETYDMEASDNFIDRTAEDPTNLNNAAIQIAGNNGYGGTVLRTYRGKASRNTILMPASPAETLGNVAGINMGPQSYYGLAEGNKIVNGTTGISFAIGNYGKAIDNTLVGQTLYGIEMARSPGCIAQANVIDGSGLLGSVAGGTAIQINGGVGVSNDIAVVNNRIFGMHINGTAIGNGAGFRVSITGNKIECMRAIFLYLVGDIVVNDNSIINTTSTNGWGVYVGDCVDVVVSSNQMRNYTSGVKLNASSTTVDNINVSDNVMEQCSNSVESVTSGSGTIGSNITNAGNVLSAT